MVFLRWGSTAHQRPTDSSGQAVVAAVGMGVVEGFLGL